MSWRNLCCCEKEVGRQFHLHLSGCSFIFTCLAAISSIRLLFHLQHSAAAVSSSAIVCSPLSFCSCVPCLTLDNVLCCDPCLTVHVSGVVIPVLQFTMWCVVIPVLQRFTTCCDPCLTVRNVLCCDPCLTVHNVLRCDPCLTHDQLT